MKGQGGWWMLRSIVATGKSGVMDFVAIRQVIIHKLLAFFWFGGDFTPNWSNLLPPNGGASLGFWGPTAACEQCRKKQKWKVLVEYSGIELNSKWIWFSKSRGLRITAPEFISHPSHRCQLLGDKRMYYGWEDASSAFLALSLYDALWTCLE